MPAVVQGPSPHSGQYKTIVYKRGATEVVHDHAAVKHLIAVLATSPPPAEVFPPKGVRQLQSTMHAFFELRVLPHEDTNTIPLAGNSPP